MQQFDKDTYIGKIRDLVSITSPQKDPFLYYLPFLIEQNVLKDITPESLFKYAQIAVLQEKSEVLLDGLKILNQLVDSNDGSMRPPSPTNFFNNQSFVWSELGGHTKNVDVISHIINKTIFVSSLGNI